MSALEPATTRRGQLAARRSDARAARTQRRRRLRGQLVSLTAIAASGALVMGAALPGAISQPAAEALPDGTAAEQAEATQLPRHFDSSTEAAATALTRDGYGALSAKQMLAARYAVSPTYTTTWTGPIRWPFPTSVPISDRYGYRPSPCSGCSTNHRGVDFLGGDQNPIYSIADGLVTYREEGGGFGNHVYIQYEIGGDVITVLYAHMRYGSSPLQVGDRVAVGQFIGLVGSTGQVTGPHLHLELQVNGEYVDPFAWLQTNAG